MAYCYKCGVELEAGAERCPLCSTMVPAAANDGSKPADYPAMAYPDSVYDPVATHELTKAERRRISLEFLSLSFLLGAGAVLLADILFQGRPHWSLYPLASISLVWMIIFSLLALRKMPALTLLTIPVSIALYLLALDWIDAPISWSLTLAIPVTLTMSLMAGAVVVCVRLTRRKGFNIVAYSLVALAAACIALEAIIDLYAHGSVALAWSIIVGLVLVPLSGMLLYIHVRIMRGADLRKVFRM